METSHIIGVYFPHESQDKVKVDHFIAQLYQKVQKLLSPLKKTAQIHYWQGQLTIGYFSDVCKLLLYFDSNINAYGLIPAMRFEIESIFSIMFSMALSNFAPTKTRKHLAGGSMPNALKSGFLCSGNGCQIVIVIFYLNSTVNFGISPVLLFQLEVYYYI